MNNVSQIAFEKYYSDHSGVEKAVRLVVDKNYPDPHSSRIEMESVSTVSFAVEDLPWLIECLERIHAEVSP